MAKVISKPTLDVRVQFEVDEIEARALVDLAGYGTDAFIQAFYGALGKAYMQRHEQGLRRFLDTISKVVEPSLHNVDRARNLLNGLKDQEQNVGVQELQKADSSRVATERNADNSQSKV